MKRNIDLTQNSDFKSKEIRGINLSGINFRRPKNIEDIFLNIGATNIIVNGYLEDIAHDNGAIKQGNSEERKEKRMMNEFGRGNFCDCCGNKIFPYYNSTLCIKCENSYRYPFGI